MRSKCGNKKTEREEIAEISHALADTLEKPKSKAKRPTSALKENFI